LTIRTLYPKESELIKKAKADDRVAQLMLYNQHAQKMLAVTRYYVKDLQHAEDVLMIAFYKAFTRIHQFKNEINFEGWLRKINNRLNRFEKKNYLSSDLVFALGINNLVDASSQLEYLEFDYLKSHFIELGWAWKTNLIPESTLLNLRYGFSFQFNSLTTRDNRMFVSYDGNVELLPIDSSIYNHRAKLNYSNLVIPIHLEIGSRNRRKHSYSENGSTVNYYYNPNSLLIGAGVYGGLRLGGKQKFKSNTEGHLAVSEELNLYDIAYGFSGYISFPKFITLYGKLDASPLFKNQSNPSHNVSLGLLFGL